jgi:hypothetical protein
MSFSDRAQLARIGLLPVTVVMQEARALLARQPAAALPALSLFADARDTASMRVLATALDSMSAAARAAGASGQATRIGDIARAYVVLARGDSAGALRALLALPMTLCNGAPCVPITTARLLMAAGRDRDAARVLDRSLPQVMQQQLTAPLLMLDRAGIAERQGDRATARRWYERVVAQWGRATAAGVKPTLEVAKAGVARMR